MHITWYGFRCATHSYAFCVALTAHEYFFFCHWAPTADGVGGWLRVVKELVVGHRCESVREKKREILKGTMLPLTGAGGGLVGGWCRGLEIARKRELLA
jgi:hypothetical protein